MLEIWVILLLPIAIVVAMLWRALRRGRQMQALVQRGRPVTGEVVGTVKFLGTASLRNRFLRYRFRADDGAVYSHKIAIGAKDYHALQPGAPIELIYLPDNPRVSARVEMVEQVREALARRKTRAG